MIKAGNYDAARERLDRAIDIDPMLMDSYKNYGDLYMAINNFQEAKNSYKKAFLIEKNGLLYFLYGNACFMNDEVHEGLEYYNMAITNGYDSDEIKVTIWVILAIILLASFVFRENIFSELNWTARCLLFALAIGTCFIGPKKVNTPSPIELQFYDSYLVLYRPKRYYSPKVTRCEINTMKYSDITKCLYKAESQRIHFYGTVDAKWFNFDKTGAMSKTPTYDRVVRDTLLYISTRCSDVDFVSEIEAHSPIRVTVENN